MCPLNWGKISFVELVQADVTKRCVEPLSFNLVLSTLISNLPSRESRLDLLRVASEVL
jgi:hypothetical protein